MIIYLLMDHEQLLDTVQLLKVWNQIGRCSPTPYSTLIFTRVSIFIKAATKNPALQCGSIERNE